MIQVTIDIPPADMAAFDAACKRYVASFSKGPKEAIKKSLVYIIRSLRASTKQSARQRKIVKHSRAKIKRMTRQQQHIAEYYERKGQPYRSKLTGRELKPQTYAVEILLQNRQKKYAYINGGESVAEAKRLAAEQMPKKYFLDERGAKKRGLAKASWGWMLGKIGKQSTSEQPEIGGTTGVSFGEIARGSSWFIFGRIENKLSYIRKALRANVGSVMQRARKAMIDEMQGHAKRARRDAGLKAA